MQDVTYFKRDKKLLVGSFRWLNVFIFEGKGKSDFQERAGFTPVLSVWRSILIRIS